MSAAFRDKYAIVGTGKSRLGQVGANSLALLEEAIKNALVEAGLTNKDIDGVVVRGADDIYSHHQMVAARLGSADCADSYATGSRPLRPRPLRRSSSRHRVVHSRRRTRSPPNPASRN